MLSASAVADSDLKGAVGPMDQHTKEAAQTPNDEAPEPTPKRKRAPRKRAPKKKSAKTSSAPPPKRIPTARELGTEVMAQRKTEGIRGYVREVSRWKCHVITADWIDKPVNDVELLDGIEWARSLQRKACARRNAGQQLSIGTIKRCVSLASAIMVEAIQRGYRKDNPFTTLRLKKRADELVAKQKWTYFTPEEENAIRECDLIPEYAKLLILFALYTGLRQGEQFHLELTELDVDGPNPCVRILYGSKGHLPPKSGKARTVPLIPQALEAAKRWLEILPTYAKSNPNNLVFPQANGRPREQGRPFGQSDAFRKYLRFAGITKHARWHDLRHGCASAHTAGWWGRKWPITEVRQMLGHSSVVVTERYSHLADTVLQDAARATVIEIPTAVRLPAANDVASIPVAAAAAVESDVSDTSIEVANDNGTRKPFMWLRSIVTLLVAIATFFTGKGTDRAA